MEFRAGHATREQAIISLFTASFAAAEGPEEGELIGAFVRDLLATTPGDDLVVWSANDGETLLGAICFSRLTFAEDDRTVFILSPVAVRTDRQKTGIGQKLIAHGLQDLRQNGVDYVITYGDPNYYAKTGFQQITEEFAKAPLKLSMPQGWLGQSLSGRGEPPLKGPSRSVPALNKQDLW